MTGQGAPSGFDRRAIPPDVRESVWHAPDGHPIRRVDWPARLSPPLGSILFMPGRGDAYEKYLETLDYWAGRGWQVTAADWRGQAGSGRLGRDPVTGHIDDFATWTSDLGAFYADWARQSPAPHVLAGHSMGGHLALRAVAQGVVRPAALVLIAPMLDFATKSLPIPVLHAAARLMAAVGDKRRPAWKWSERPGELPQDRIDLLTHDADRYADELWWRERRPELVMGPGSWGWVERAYASMRLLTRPGLLEAVRVPVLILATEVDRLVGTGAILRAAERLPDCTLVLFGPEARHEILRESDSVRNQALEAIDNFLNKAAAAERSNA